MTRVMGDGSAEVMAQVRAEVMAALARLFGVVALAVAASLAHAGPAPWYRWQSLVDGRTFCAQIAPGPGWKRVDGPFADAGCRRRKPVSQPGSS